MPNPPDPIAIANASIAAAQQLVLASQALVEHAHDQLVAAPPAITIDDYQHLLARHTAVIFYTNLACALLLLWTFLIGAFDPNAPDAPAPPP